MKESFYDLQTFLLGKSFAGQNLFWRERGEFWFTNASMDFFDFFFKYGDRWYNYFYYDSI